MGRLQWSREKKYWTGPGPGLGFDPRNDEKRQKKSATKKKIMKNGKFRDRAGTGPLQKTRDRAGTGWTTDACWLVT